MLYLGSISYYYLSFGYFILKPYYFYVFLNGGTNFFLIEVPLGNEFAEINSAGFLLSYYNLDYGAFLFYTFFDKFL